MHVVCRNFDIKPHFRTEYPFCTFNRKTQKLNKKKSFFSLFPKLVLLFVSPSEARGLFFVFFWWDCSFKQKVGKFQELCLNEIHKDFVGVVNNKTNFTIVSEQVFFNCFVCFWGLRDVCFANLDLTYFAWMWRTKCWVFLF